MSDAHDRIQASHQWQRWVCSKCPHKRSSQLPLAKGVMQYDNVLSTKKAGNGPNRRHILAQKKQKDFKVLNTFFYSTRMSKKSNFAAPTTELNPGEFSRYEPIQSHF